MKAPRRGTGLLVGLALAATAVTAASPHTTTLATAGWLTDTTEVVTCAPTVWGDVSEVEWNALLVAGWTGAVEDRMEALYAPHCN